MLPLLQQGMASLLAFEEIQSHGLPASFTYFTRLYDSFTDEMILLTDELSTNYFNGRSINPNGDKDSLDFISHIRRVTNDPRVKCTKTTPTGLPSTAKDSIEHLRYLDGRAGKAFSLFFNWREVQHRRDGFAAPILGSMHKGNLHLGTTDTHNIMGELKTTRTSSRRPSMGKKEGEGINLLNLPSRGGLDMVEGLNKKIRKGFLCPPGESLLADDYSQMELRILADVSQDPTMLDIYHNEGDIHATTAEYLFNVPPHKQKDDIHRKPAKAVNFGTGYGASSHKLYTMYRQMGIDIYSEQDAEHHRQGFFNRYPGVANWKEEYLWEARRRGYVESHAGMRRYLPNLWSRDKRQRSKAEREAINHCIQATAQDMIQHAMAWIYVEILKLRNAGIDVWLALQLYDELIHRVEDDYVELVDEVVMKGLTQHHGRPDFRVPILADSSSGKCWGEL